MALVRGTDMGLHAQFNIELSFNLLRVSHIVFILNLSLLFIL